MLSTIKTCCPHLCCWSPWGPAVQRPLWVWGVSLMHHVRLGGLREVISGLCTQTFLLWDSVWSRAQVTPALRLPWRFSGKESACQCKRCRFNPWVGKIPWRRKWQPTPVFFPGESRGQRSLMGYSLSIGHNLETKQ